MLTPNQSVISLSGDHSALTDFDLAARSVKWSAPGHYETSPAVANGVVYALNNNPFQLEARNEADGSLLWTWAPSGYDGSSFGGGNIIATNNMLLLSTDRMVHVISLTGHTSVWRYFHPGQLAFSANGVLYVASSSHLYAVNMK